MRFFFVFVAAAASALAAAAADVDVSLSADTAAVGDVVELQLTSSEGSPQLSDFPELEHGRWLRNGVSRRQSLQIVNGRRSSRYTTGYAIRAESEGVLRVPSLRVVVDGRSHETKPVSVRIVPAGDQNVAADDDGDGEIPLREVLFGRIVIQGGRSSYYLGEEIPAQLQLFVGGGLQLRSFPDPELTTPDAVLLTDDESPQEDGSQRQTVVNGRRYQVYSRPFRFRSLAAGALRPAASGDVVVSIRRRSFPGDDPFGSFFGIMDRTDLRRYPVKYESGREIEIKALPPLPERSVSLSLVGRWHVGYSLDAPAKIRAGDVVTLRAEITGEGAMDTLTAPQLDVPGFRVYPPETKPLPGGGRSLSWAMIPLRAGTVPLKLNLAYFNTDRGEYETAPFERILTVLPPERPLDSSVSDSGERGSVRPPAAAKAENQRRPGLLYLKTKPCSASPPASGGFWAALLLLLAGGPLLFLSASFLRRLRLSARGDGIHARRAAARRVRRAVLKRVGGAKTPADLNAVLHACVVPMLNDYYGFPPGQTVRELADRVDDPELASVLRRLDDDAYLPGAERSGEFCRDRLLRALKRVMVIGALWCGLVACGFTPAQSPERRDVEQAFRRGMDAYDAGKFQEALETYRSVRDPARPDSALLYNLGCAAFMLRDYPLAVYYFECSRRLNPLDSAALENLNAGLRKLGLPEEGRTSTPAELLVRLRDVLRPEWWLLLGAGCWLALWIVLTFRSRLGRHSVGVAGCALTLLMLSCLAAFTTQVHGGPYGRGRAIVMKGGARLRSLPASSGEADGEITAGEEVRILETRQEYVLIRSGKREGWAPAGTVRRIFE